MLVFKTETGLRDHIRNFAAGKRLYSDGEPLLAPHAIYPVIEHRGVRTQLLPRNFTIFTNSAFELGSDIPPAACVNMVSQHQIESGQQIRINIEDFRMISNNLWNVIYDPDDVVEAEDGERLTREQSEMSRFHKIFRCSQEIIRSTELGMRVEQSADTPIYCEIRGWAMQIARETINYNVVYDTPFIPVVTNKIIVTKDSIKESPTCSRCSSLACAVAYRVGTGTDYVCAACAGTIPIFESLRSVICPEPPLKLPRDLLMLPAKIEVHDGVRFVVTAARDCTYIGVPDLTKYYAATNYEGLPLPNPVLYAVNLV